tara:strand:- start:456 stop:1499 length:1044 start_codon:yes stop_codon:yes gene_type:complete
VKDKIDYKSAGVDIDAGNKSVELIKKHVQSTFTNNVLTGIGSFGSLYDLKEVSNNYDHPVMVQSIDGVGTKMIVARMMNNFNSIGMDLLSAAANDILVMGAKPITLLDYIATEKLKPEFIEQIVSGMSKACQETGVSLVGGEIAEMPDTYLKGEYDLVGIITGIVEKNKIISGEKIKSGDKVLALPSSGLHTNGYSLARKLIFEIEKLSINDTPKGMDQSIGEILLEPHTNYTNQIQSILDNDILPSGIAHITGGGLLENIPRILPKDLNVFINKGSWPILPIFNLLQSIGNISEQEMYRVFNMGVGMVLIVDDMQAKEVTNLLMNQTKIYEIGYIMDGENKVLFNE